MSRNRVEEYLRNNRVPFQIHHHPVAYTAQQVAHTEHIPGQLVVKVVVVFADDRMALLALPAPLHVDLKKAASALDARKVRLATEDEFSGKFPDCEIGAVPPFGNLYDLPLYVDKALAGNEMIHFQAATHEDTLAMAYADFASLVAPDVVDIATRETVRP
jgi:Ala-tRNA(Pro) deacylase